MKIRKLLYSLILLLLPLSIALMDKISKDNISINSSDNLSVNKNNPVEEIVERKSSIPSSKKLSEDAVPNSVEDLEEVAVDLPDGKVIQSDKNYKIYDSSKEDEPAYRYEIYNNLNKMIYSATIGRCPTITYFSDSLLNISWNAGLDTWFVQYYDIKNDIFSETFDTPLEFYKDKIAYMEYSDDAKHKLVVCDIFDKTKFYKEFHLEDLAPTVISSNAIRKVKFINNTDLKVIYDAGESFEKKTVVLKLD